MSPASVASPSPVLGEDWRRSDRDDKRDDGRQNSSSKEKGSWPAALTLTL